MAPPPLLYSDPPRRRRSWVARTLLFLAVITGLVLGAGAYTVATNEALLGAFHTAVSGGLRPEQSFPGQRKFTLLLLGRDRDVDDRRQVLKTRGRSDLMMLAQVDFDRNRLDLISIPRDSRVRIPRHGVRKINAALQLGGPELSVKTVERLTGVRADHHVLVDFEGFQKAIDALGGVVVDVDRDMDYDDDWAGLHIHLKKGRQHLNGREAMGFVRFRHSDRGNGDTDYARQARQQKLLAALKARVRDPRAMSRVPAALESVRRHVEGTLSDAQLVCLANWGRSLGAAGVRMARLPGEEGPVYVRVRRSEARRFVARHFGRLDGELEPLETAITSDPEVTREARAPRRSIRRVSAASLRPAEPLTFSPTGAEREPLGTVPAARAPEPPGSFVVEEGTVPPPRVPVPGGEASAEQQGSDETAPDGVADAHGRKSRPDSREEPS